MPRLQLLRMGDLCGMQRRGPIAEDEHMRVAEAHGVDAAHVAAHVVDVIVVTVTVVAVIS